MQNRLCNIVTEIGKPPVEMKAASGVPQGDPLSSFLFSLAMEPILEMLKAKGHEVVVYLDDFLIGINENENSQQIIELMNEEVAKYGLEINPDKCATTANGGTIQYLGQKF